MDADGWVQRDAISGCSCMMQSRVELTTASSMAERCAKPYGTDKGGEDDLQSPCSAKHALLVKQPNREGLCARLDFCVMSRSKKELISLMVQGLLRVKGAGSRHACGGESRYNTTVNLCCRGPVSVITIPPAHLLQPVFA